MARGRLRCIGTSLRLKMRFGSGYRISIRVQGGTSSSGSSSQTEEGALDGDFLIPATPTTEAAADSAPRCKEQQLRSGSGEEQRSTLGRLQAARIKAVFADRLGVTAGGPCMRRRGESKLGCISGSLQEWGWPGGTH